VAGGLLCPAIVSRLGPQKSLTVALGIIPFPFLAMMAPEAFIVGIGLFAQTFFGTLWTCRALVPPQVLV